MDNQSKEDDMDLDEVLVQKRTNLEKLILNIDDAIQKEMLKYDEAEFYIRLQSECFNLYPVVVKALSLQIAEDRRRDIFCSIVKGHKLDHIADFYKMTPKDVVKEFRSSVYELRHRVDSGAFTEKESVNLLLQNERNALRCKLREYFGLHQKQRKEIDELQEQIRIMHEEEIKRNEDELISNWKLKQALKRKILEELQEELNRKLESQLEAQLENRSMALLENTPLRDIIRMRCKKWFKTKILDTK